MRRPYPIATMRRAIELIDAEWTPTEARRLLQAEGHDAPSLTTIYLWTRPDYRERHNRATRQRAARRTAEASSYRWPANRTVEWRIGRARALAELDLSMAAIAKVMSFDFPDTPISEHQVERMVRLGTTPRSMRAAA